MKRHLTDIRGFTLAEVLVVTGILGIVMGAIFSLYITNLKSATTQDETLEMQQNLRMAMETISRSLKNAGMLVPQTLTALKSSSSSTALTLYAASSDAVYARVTATKIRSTAYANYSAPIDSAAGFSTGDRIRVIKILDNSPVFAGYTSLFVSATGGTNLKFVQGISSNTFSTGTDVSMGDMIAKAASPAATGMYDTVTFDLVSGGSCPANQTCLERVTNGVSEIIAGYFASSGVQFSYVDVNGYDQTTPSADTRAVRITLNGTATTANGVKSKQLISLIKLRNVR